ncbi:serine hydroxymethyltransferase, mitochondrial [Artemisia annua]|uniref:Serine hydroxymethyltransferase, mitochondrial n=1 Tax=Artemisia annua TaxID=35608 RepID=A0A2U1M6Y7_ARTAN|nr:serine hydroxymethyltransferase, mitochondrial [Artemisia annua]
MNFIDEKKWLKQLNATLEVVDPEIADVIGHEKACQCKIVCPSMIQSKPRCKYFLPLGLLTWQKCCVKSVLWKPFLWIHQNGEPLSGSPAKFQVYNALLKFSYNKHLSGFDGHGGSDGLHAYVHSPVSDQHNDFKGKNVFTETNNANTVLASRLCNVKLGFDCRQLSIFVEMSTVYFFLQKKPLGVLIFLVFRLLFITNFLTMQFISI